MNWIAIISEQLEETKTSMAEKQAVIESCQERSADDGEVASNITTLRITEAEKSKLQVRHAKLAGALVRAKTGDFGYCEECGIDIPERRLIPDPSRNLCVDCQSTVEHENKQFSA